jgi:hypothetical protein
MKIIEMFLQFALRLAELGFRVLLQLIVWAIKALATLIGSSIAGAGKRDHGAQGGYQPKRLLKRKTHKARRGKPWRS